MTALATRYIEVVSTSRNHAMPSGTAISAITSETVAQNRFQSVDGDSCRATLNMAREAKAMISMRLAPNMRARIGANKRDKRMAIKKMASDCDEVPGRKITRGNNARSA